MSKVIVDASTVLAFLANEPGGDVARQYCKRAMISAVNLTEVLQKAIERNSLAVTQAILRQIEIQVVPYNSQLALVTAELKVRAKSKGLSLADCACLALGLTEKRPIVTGDQKWEELGLDIELLFFRKWSSTLS